MSVNEIKKLIRSYCCACGNKTWTTEDRPISPTEGTRGYNKTLHTYEYWNGTTWIQY